MLVPRHVRDPEFFNSLGFGQFRDTGIHSGVDDRARERRERAAQEARIARRKLKETIRGEVLQELKFGKPGIPIDHTQVRQTLPLSLQEKGVQQSVFGKLSHPKIREIHDMDFLPNLHDIGNPIEVRRLKRHEVYELHDPQPLVHGHHARLPQDPTMIPTLRVHEMIHDMPVDARLPGYETTSKFAAPPPYTGFSGIRTAF